MLGENVNTARPLPMYRMASRVDIVEIGVDADAKVQLAAEPGSDLRVPGRVEVGVVGAGRQIGRRQSGGGRLREPDPPNSEPQNPA